MKDLPTTRPSAVTDFAPMLATARAFFQTGQTLDPSWRLARLRDLRTAIKKAGPDIDQALQQDLHKSSYEAFMTETAMVLDELDHAIRHLRRWARPSHHLPSLAQLPAAVRVHPEPYGVVLIISPWNYPLQLTLVPLIAALAAGNVAILKPSSTSAATTALLTDLLTSALPAGLVQVVPGGADPARTLLDHRFDHIFFTGSPATARDVMAAAARHLTPVTLELGGKSPVIIDETADLALAARRVLFGKLLNAGQTCVAPDHVLVHRSLKPAFITELTHQLASLTADPDFASSWPRAASPRQFNRLMGLLQGQTILVGGGSDPDRLSIEPTLVDEPDPTSPLMQEELFGPILPILGYDSWPDLVARLATAEHPLALYLFTRDRRHEAEILRRVPFGGGCINDTILHITSPRAPFGGVGNSGMGRYHGRHGFEAFSHFKTVLKMPRCFDNALRYRPYSEGKLRWLKRLLK